jgi:signal transduction histidine kinase
MTTSKAPNAANVTIRNAPLSTPGADTHPAEIQSQIRELKRQVFDLNTLFDVARQFHEVWDVDALLDGILLIAIEHVRVGAAAVATCGPDDAGRLTRQRSKGWDLSTEPIWSVSIESSWAKRLAEYRRPLPVEALGAYASDAGAQIEALRRAGCVVVAPMVRHDQLRGVLYLSEKVHRASYTSGDFAFLDLLMDQFAVSLDNAYLYEREQRTNDQLSVTKQRLAVAEKLAALGQMAATIAHEVRNPAGIIRNYLSLIRPALEGRKTETGQLDAINEELGRIELFVKSLLGAFHPDQSQPASLALAAQVDQVAAFLKQRLAQHQVTFVNRLDGAVPAVHAEPEALRQVLLNLILNGIDAMPSGGELTFAASADHDRVHLSVTDTGAGVPVDLLDRLFDPYVTTKPEGEGSGLGLSICRSLLERFDAQIGARNLTPPAHGAVFTIHLRRADSPGRNPIVDLASAKHFESHL